MIAIPTTLAPPSPADGDDPFLPGDGAFQRLTAPWLDLITHRSMVFPRAMPRLRALEIYRSRITEQGRAHLYACKKLDSVQIKSSVPVSAPAVARLQTELPNLRTVDITQSQPSMRPRPVQTARAALIR